MIKNALNFFGKGRSKIEETIVEEVIIEEPKKEVIKEKVERVKFASCLDPKLKKKLKLSSIKQGKKIYQVLEEALTEYLD